MPTQYDSFGVPRSDLGAALYEYTPKLNRFIGTMALPILNVSEEEASISKVTRESFMTPDDDKRAPGGTYNEVDLPVEDFSYKCEDRGLVTRIDQGRRRKYERYFDVERAHTELIWHKLLLNREIEAQALLFNTTTWDTGDSDLYTNAAGTSAWATASTDIIGDVQDAVAKVLQNSGMTPNALICGDAVFRQMITNDAISGKFNADIVTWQGMANALAAVVGIGKIIVGDMVKHSSGEGQDLSGTSVWGQTYAMVAHVPEANADPSSEPAVGRTFLWTEDSPDIVTVEQEGDWDTRSDKYRVRHSYQMKVQDKYFGHLIKVN
jgi:hypothetical protein